MAAGSFKIYGLQKDGSRIPAAGSAGDGVASDALKLGGKAPEYYIQPRNLLDNSDFTNPVNQRGQNSYTATEYSIDRWKKMSNNTTLSVEDGFIRITSTATSGRQAVQQQLPNNYAGKTLTTAWCLADGSISCASAVIPEPDGEDHFLASANIGNNSFRVRLNPSGVLTARILVSYGESIDLRWVAVYEGAYTIDTLPPYVPKGYDQELLVCNMYSLQDGSFLGPSMQMELLWENASPTSSFAAQTVSVALTEYDLYAIAYKFSSANIMEMTQISRVGSNMNLISLDSNNIKCRFVTYDSGKLTFTTGYNRSFNPSAQSEDATMIIPVCIYGIKGVS